MSKRKKLLNILKYLLFLGAGILLVYWQLKDMTAVQKSEFNNAYQNANYWVIIPIVVMALLAHYSRALRWKLLMKALDYNPATKNVFAATLIGYFGNAAVPRLGEVLRCTFLAKYENLKLDRLFGTILVERIFDLICYLIFILITVLIQMDVVGNYVFNKINAINQAPGMPLWAKLILGVASFMLLLYLLNLLRRKFPQNKFILKVNGFVDGIIAGFASVKKLKKKNQFLSHTLFIWLMYLLQIYIGFTAMEGTAELGIKAACSVLALATLAMIATPAGLGVFPFFVMQTLSMYAISDATGMAFGWLIWGVNTGIVIITGLISLLAMPMMNRKKLSVAG